jgi:hypothetical protein
MRSHYVLLAAALMLTAPLVNAQEGRARQRQPDSSSGSSRSDGTRSAQPRSAPREDSRRDSAPASQAPAPQQQRAERAQQRPERPQPRAERAQPAARAAAPEARALAGDGQGERRAGARDRNPGDNRANGRAVPRQGPPPQVRGRDNDRRDNDRRNDDNWRGRSYNRNVYIYPRTRVFTYYDYPRRYFPFGYAGFGPGYYYYDRDWRPYSAYDAPYRFNPYRYGYPTGEVRLDVDQTFAEVWVDGYYAGTVDDFDGIFQGLTLEEGTYNIEIAAPGYEPLVFDIRIYPGQRITYRGDLLRARGDRGY